MLSLLQILFFWNKTSQLQPRPQRTYPDLNSLFSSYWEPTLGVYYANRCFSMFMTQLRTHKHYILLFMQVFKLSIISM